MTTPDPLYVALAAALYSCGRTGRALHTRLTRKDT